MGSRYLKALTARLRWATAAALFALLLAATLVFGTSVQAQESTTEQPGGATASETGAGGATSETAEGTTATKEQDPAGEDRETTAPAAENEDAVAQAQDTPDKPKQETQSSGQQAQTQADTADEDDAQATFRATPQGRAATIIDNDGDPDVDRINVSISDCDVSDDAFLVIVDGNGRRERFTEGGNAEITSDDNLLRVDVDRNIDTDFGVEGIDDDGLVLVSSGITCGRDDSGGGGDDGDGDGNNGNAGNDNDLNCDELLRRFRGEGGEAQYVDVDIQNQLIVCLEQEVDQDTAADEDLPNTGGPSLIGLAVLGVAFAVAGTALVRGRRKE